ncbi:MAG TPA: class I SAM-dependent methyltransferase [Acetobacteraceae bacterium]|jgi:SAM-dependent methyltransferase|nr:class I SAM-dependent methyltransferase [Acetobacteraceae bacterium]
MTRQNSSLASHYDQTFYDRQIDGRLKSARKYAAILATMLLPKSVLDIGCGRGTWLKAFSERGAERLVGIDGPWNSQAGMIDSSIQFAQCDLENMPMLGERFDLSLSLEVGEHLSMNAAEKLIAALCGASDIVVFGAAVPGQGGINHINEQPQSFWASKFLARGYSAFDLFRPKVWEDEDVEVYYRQNTFLYAKEDALQPECKQILECCRISSLAFMDIRHPDLAGIKVHLAALEKAIKRRLGSTKAS